MSFTFLGQGTAVPKHSIGVDEAVWYAQTYFCNSDEERRKLGALYRLAGVQRRHTVLLEGPEVPGEARHNAAFPAPAFEGDAGPSIGTRMGIYERHASGLALEAAREALAESGERPKDITHLVTVSCTGFSAPGVDMALIRGLGLDPTVQRTHVGFMGCHGALNGLRVARGFAGSDPDACVLLAAVELCSIHYHYGSDPEQIVANALFADGAGAVVGRATGGADDAWRIAATGSVLIPDSQDAMSWRIGDNGFSMGLSPRVPDLIARHLREWIEGWLAGHGLRLEDVKSWAVHPGGPRVLTAVSRTLGLPKGALDVSKETLRDYGNMSSPTVLFILRRLRSEAAPRPCVALGFGPGLVAEAALFA